MNWSHVVSHLRLADRIKAFRYHMKEVSFVYLSSFFYSLHLSYLFVSFQPKSLDETIYKDKTYPAKLFLIRNVLLHCTFFFFAVFIEFLTSFSICLCLDNSALDKDVYGPSPDIFRVYTAFATFTYSQLQVILPDSFLGEVSEWDHFLSIDLSSNSPPFKSAADFLRNRDFANLVAESDIPTPTHFVEQALCFCRNICALLLSHKVCKSNLVRGFSIFDEAIVRHGEEEDYSRECEMHCDFFVESKWISSNVNP